MRRRMISALAAVVVMLGGHARPASTQQAEVEVRTVVDALFDAMRAGDGEALSALLHPDARLQTVGLRDGEPALRTEAIDAFVLAIGAPREEVWDERISDFEARVDGDLAAAWMYYRFYVGERFSHCGVNAMQLFRTADGWRITQITDTRRLEGCG